MAAKDFRTLLAELPPDTPITASHVAAIIETLLTRDEGHAIDIDALSDGQLIDEEILANWLSESPSTLQKWRVKGGGPAFVKNPKSVRYKVGSVRAWIDSRTVSSTSEVTTRRLSGALSFQSNFVDLAFGNSPVMLVGGKHVEFFDSVHRCIEDEPERYVIIDVAQLSAIREPVIPESASAVQRAQLEQLLDAFLDFVEKVRQKPDEAEAGFDSVRKELPTPLRVAYFVHAAAHAPKLARKIATTFEGDLLSDSFSLVRWAWATDLEVAVRKSAEPFVSSLSVVAEYVPDLNRADRISDARGRTIYRGSLGHFFACLGSNSTSLAAWDSDYEHSVRTLLEAGLDVDFQETLADMSPRATAAATENSEGTRSSAFLKVVQTYESYQQLSKLLR